MVSALTTTDVGWDGAGSLPAPEARQTLGAEMLRRSATSRRLVYRRPVELAMA